MTSLEHPHSTLLATRIVDFGPVARNMGRVRDITSNPILAVVKANGFGHGITEVATTALESGAEWFGVATVDEALALRSAGITSPVLCWLADPRCDLRTAVAAGTGVGDNHAGVASSETTLVLVPVCYGDGIPRDLSHGGEVVLRGLPADGEPDSQEWAAVTGTIAHEILTGPGGRMARRHINQTKGTLS